MFINPIERGKFTRNIGNFYLWYFSLYEKAKLECEFGIQIYDKKVKNSCLYKIDHFVY